MFARSKRTATESLDLAAPASTRARVRRRYHFGSSGFVYVFVTLLIALGAFNSQNNLLFWAFGFSLATLIVSGLLSGAMLMGVTVTRERIGDAHAGGVLTIRYRVRNANRAIPVFAVTIEETMVSDVTAKREAVGRFARNRRRETPNVEKPKERIDPPRVFIAHVGPRETVFVECRSMSHRRGPVGFRSFTVTTTFPFGIMRKSLEFESPANTVILPTVAPIEALALDAAALDGESARSSRLRGQGEEFHSLRDYVPGDNPRSIAWKASARRGQLLVRQSLAPSPLRVWVVLRLRISSTQTDGCDERAISVAAAMIGHARARSIAVGLAAPLTGLSIPPRSDPAHYDRLMRELGQLELGPVDLRGRQLPFPLAAASHHDACLCIHAGAADALYGPVDRVTHYGVFGETDMQAKSPPRRGRGSEAIRAMSRPVSPARRGGGA